MDHHTSDRDSTFSVSRPVQANTLFDVTIVDFKEKWKKTLD